MKYTKGNWKVMPGKSAPRICVKGDKDWPIVVTISGHSDDGIKANENLIAAAPELYESLDRCLHEIENNFFDYMDERSIGFKHVGKLVIRAKKALQKARGQS